MSAANQVSRGPTVRDHFVIVNESRCFTGFNNGNAVPWLPGVTSDAAEEWYLLLPGLRYVIAVAPELLIHSVLKRLAASLGQRGRVTPRTVLTGVLGVVLVAGILGLGVIVVMPVELTEPYTEFYLLNTDEQAGAYPTDLRVGETGTVVVGIENHEHREMTYTVVVLTNRGVHEERTITVKNDAQWRGSFSYAFELRGERTVVFALYRGESPDLGHQPYRRVYLHVTVA